MHGYNLRPLPHRVNRISSARSHRRLTRYFLHVEKIAKRPNYQNDYDAYVESAKIDWIEVNGTIWMDTRACIDYLAKIDWTRSEVVGHGLKMDLDILECVAYRHGVDLNFGGAKFTDVMLDNTKYFSQPNGSAKFPSLAELWEFKRGDEPMPELRTEAIKMIAS